VFCIEGFKQGFEKWQLLLRAQLLMRELQMFQPFGSQLCGQPARFDFRFNSHTIHLLVEFTQPDNIRETV